MQTVDPVRQVRDAARKKRRQPKILLEAKEAVKAEKQAKAEKNQKPQRRPRQRPSKPKGPQAKKELPEEKNLPPNPNPNPNLSPTATVGEPGQPGEEDDGGDGRLPFTIGELPEEEEAAPIRSAEEPQDPVAFLTNLVNGLADKMGALMQKVSAHDQMVVFAKDVLRAQGVEIPEMEGEAPQPAAAATEDGAVPEQTATAAPTPIWLTGIRALTEFMDQAKGFAGSMGGSAEPGESAEGAGPVAQTDPFEAVGTLVSKVFDIEDKISARAAKAHEANLKALGPVIKDVVQSVLGGKKTAEPPAE